MPKKLRIRKEVTLDREPVPSKTANPDEVSVRPLIDRESNLIAVPSVLSYPLVCGAVDITNADLRRLDPGAFLNDSLIEFGLG